MPNWCDNRLVVRGPNAALQRLRDAVTGVDVQGTEMPFSFERIDPTPAAYRDGTARWEDSEEFERLSERFEEVAGDPEMRLRFLDENPGFYLVFNDRMASAALGEPYRGTPGAWRQQHWGTKWELKARDCQLEERDTELVYVFSNAWDPPISVLNKLAAQFADLEFELVYCEPGSAFAGEALWASGQKLSSRQIDEGLHAFLQERWPDAADEFESDYYA